MYEFTQYSKIVLFMKKHKKCLRRYSKKISSPISTSFSSQQKLFSKKHRRRKQRRRRRKQRRMKIPKRSMSMTTQIASNALNMLHISTESDSEEFELIERNELVRHHVLTMPSDQCPIVLFEKRPFNSVFSIKTHETNHVANKDSYSSHA